MPPRSRRWPCAASRARPDPATAIARRARIRLVAGTFAFLAALGLWAAWDLLQIRQDLEAGRSALDDLDLEATSSDGLTVVADRAAGHLQAADETARTSPPLRLLAVLPGVGDQIDGIRRMTGATAELGSSGAEAARNIDAKLAGAGEPAGRVALLDTALGEVRRIRRDLGEVDLGTSAGLVGPLRDAHVDLVHTIERARTKLDDADDLITPIRDMLEGPTTFLLLASNNAEMAGGSGLALSAALLEFDGGEIELGEVFPASYIRLEDSVPVPPDLLEVYRPTGIGIDFRSSTRSPNLPAMGPLIAEMTEARQIGTIDGVLIVDAVTLEIVMDVTGPIDLDGKEISSDNVLAEVLNENYQRFQTADDRQERVSYQGEIAKQVFESLTTRDVPAANLASALLDATEGRHLMLWSRDPALEDSWEELGAAGELDPLGLMICFQNYGADKLDWYLRPSASMDVGLLPNGDYRAQLTMTIRVPEKDEMPEASPYILGPYPDEHGVFLTVHLPEAAYDITTTHQGGFRTKGTDGPLQVRTFLTDVPLGDTMERTVEFSLPREVGGLVLLPSARVEPLPLRIDDAITIDDDIPLPFTWLAAIPPPADGAAPPAVRWAVVASTVALLLAALATVQLARRPATPSPRAVAVAQLAALSSLALVVVAAALALVLGERPL